MSLLRCVLIAHLASVVAFRPPARPLDSTLGRRARFSAARPVGRPAAIGAAEGSSTNGPAALAGFFKDRAAGFSVAAAIGFAGERVASRVPIALSPLLYATAFGIAIGNLLRLADPEMKALEPAAEGLSFAKRRLLRAGIILYGAKVTFAKILGIGLPGLLTDPTRMKQPPGSLMQTSFFQAVRRARKRTLRSPPLHACRLGAPCCRASLRRAT